MSDLLAGHEPAPTIAEQIAVVERELRRRKLVYPRLINTRRLNPHRADWELRTMTAVLKTLEWLRDFGGLNV